MQASGGGPAEDNVTGFLVRSTSTQWSKGSVLAVDAGSHLSAISRLLEPDFPRVSGVPLNGAPPGPKTPSSASTSGRPPISRTISDQGSETSDSSRATSLEPPSTVLESGPFAGLAFPFESARANALHLVRECVATYLITHPHLDHLSAFAINTAAFHNTSRPKRLAALPSTVNAIKTHIFNDVIWPNLTDEDGGVGFVTFQRLTDGGNLAVGSGSRKGYMEVCDGLCVKGMKISHGHCMRHTGDPAMPRGSEVGLSEVPTFRSQASSNHHHHHDSLSVSPTKLRRTPSLTHVTVPGTPGATISGSHPSHTGDNTTREVVVDSTAFFIRDDHSGREILVFGDVEPDALSLNPRTLAVWTEAAPKIASNHLRAILIECSYDDSQGDSILFGHLAPRHLIKELVVLADMVKRRRREHQERRNSRKRKRSTYAPSHGLEVPGASAHPEDSVEPSRAPSEEEENEPNSTKRGTRKQRPAQLMTAKAQVYSEANSEHAPSPLARFESHVSMDGASSADPETVPPLAGLTVVVIHVKDTLKDGPLVGDTILAQLRDHEAKLKDMDGIGLGCDFVISKVGESYGF
ncbi:MAG: hypothetical protein Q9159_002972 [Coniocarpon cinnabarinum]